MNSQNLWHSGSISPETNLIFPKNFFNVRSDTIEKQGIIYLSSYSSKSYVSIILCDSVKLSDSVTLSFLPYFSLLNFLFYWFVLEYILVILVGMSKFSLSFLKLRRIWWVSLIKYGCFFHVISLSLIAIDSHENIRLALGLIDTHSAAVSMRVVTKFSYSSFEVCISDVSWRVSNLSLRILNIDCLYPLASEEQSYREVLLVSFLFLHRLRRIFAETNLWSEDTHSKKEYAS